MEEILGIILLVVTIVISLPIIGFMTLCGILWFVDWRQERRFKKNQKGELSKEDWKNGEREAYKKWLGY